MGPCWGKWGLVLHTSPVGCCGFLTKTVGYVAGGGDPGHAAGDRVALTQGQQAPPLSRRRRLIGA